eukprot:2081424-Amphidinium_carterae.1
MLWASVELQLTRADSIFAAVVARVEKAPEKFIARELAATLQAAAILQLDKDKVEPILAVVLDRMTTAAEEFKVQDVSTLFSAAVELQLASDKIEPIIDAVIASMNKAPEDFRDEELCKVMSAAATLQPTQAAAGLVDIALPVAVQRTVDHPHEFSLENFADVLVCCATYRRSDPALLSTVLSEVEVMGPFSEMDVEFGLARLIWAFRQLGRVPHELL